MTVTKILASFEENREKSSELQITHVETKKAKVVH